MTGQMPDIINRIDALKYKAWVLLGKEPNTIYMSIADYRRFCEETADMWIVGADKVNYGKGELMARSDSTPRPTQIMLMRIVKRAGEMECAFVPPVVESDEDRLPTLGTICRTCVHGNDFMTCAKCISPIAGKEFASNHDTIKISMVNTVPLAEARSQLAAWFSKNAVESQRFRLEVRMPEICESGAVFDGDKILWVMRFDKDFLMSAHTKIPIGDVKDVLTLVRIEQ